MKISIIDDDNRVTAKAEKLIENYRSKNEVIMECTSYGSPEAFLKDFDAGRFQIIFMDVYFGAGSMNGVEASRKIRELDQKVIIIFLTDSEEHMPDAFSVHAFSYIRKPELEERIETVLDDAMRVLPHPRMFSFMQRRQNISLNVEDIIYAQTAGHYIELQDIHGNMWRPRMTFTELSDKLKDIHEFLQINKGILVNMEHIRGFEDNSVIMIDGNWLPVRVRGYAGIVRKWHEYNFSKIRSESDI